VDEGETTIVGNRGLYLKNPLIYWSVHPMGVEAREDDARVRLKSYPKEDTLLGKEQPLR
jgi:hypothetical protein